MSSFASCLEDLCRWADQIPDPYATRLGLGTSWPRPGQAPGQFVDNEDLPFRLNARFDDVETKGPLGVVSRAGLEDLLDHWRWTLVDSLGLPHEMWIKPWAWLRRHAQRIEEEFLDFEALAAEVRETHGVVARLVGANPDQLGACPRCSAPVLSWPGSSGMIEPTCSGCAGVWRSTDALHEDQVEAYRIRLRQSISELWLSRRDVTKIHPSVSNDLLRQWIRRGKVRTASGGLVDLGDVNRAAGTAISPAPAAAPNARAG